MAVNTIKSSLYIGASNVGAEFLETAVSPLPKQIFDEIKIDLLQNNLNAGLQTIDACQQRAEFDVVHNIRQDGGAIPDYVNLQKYSGVDEDMNPPAGAHEYINVQNNVPKGFANIYIDGYKMELSAVQFDTQLDLTPGEVAKFISKGSGYVEDISKGAPAQQPPINNNPFLTVGCATIVMGGTTQLDAEKIVISYQPTMQERYIMGRGKTQDIVKLAFVADVTLDPVNYIQFMDELKKQTDMALRIVLDADANKKPQNDKSLLILAPRAVPTNIDDKDNKGNLSRTVRFSLMNDATSKAIRFLTGTVAGL